MLTSPFDRLKYGAPEKHMHNCAAVLRNMWRSSEALSNSAAGGFYSLHVGPPLIFAGWQYHFGLLDSPTRKALAMVISSQMS